MTAQRLTDAQIAAALRAHLPAHARSDVRGRITAEISTVPQARPLPALLGRLTDADPDARRRVMLLAAAALLLLGFVVAAAVGNLLRRDAPLDLLTADPARDAPAFVRQAYAAHARLPAMTLVANIWDEEAGSPVDAHRYVFDGQDSVRHECCDGSIIIQAGQSRGSTNEVGDGEKIWLIEGTPDRRPAAELVMYNGFASPECKSGWRYAGPDLVIGRAAHHLACPVEPQDGVVIPDHEVWLDAELGIALRSVTYGIQLDENNEAVSAHRSNMEVVKFELVEPAADEFRPPSGLPRFTAAELMCRDDPSTCEASQPPSTPLPATTPEPGPFVLLPPGVQDLVDDTLARYTTAAAMKVVIEERGQREADRHWFTDGLGAFREEWHFDPGSRSSPTVYVTNSDGWFESRYQPDGTTRWGRLGDGSEVPMSIFALGLPDQCGEGWRLIGLDRLLGREAWHIACGPNEFWIDRERLLVVRHAPPPDALSYTVDTQTVLSLEIGPQPRELFQLPEGAVMSER